MATNNLGNNLDSSGNVAVDFVWGNLPIQPDDERGTSAVVTAASASGGTVTYTAVNNFSAGQNVSITGLSTAAFNLTNVTLATATPTQFTVTNAATGTGVSGATATATVVAKNIGGGTGDKSWSSTSQVISARLDMTLDNHGRVGTGFAGYPGFAAAGGNYIVTAAKGDGTTVTYTSQNNLAVGATVNITGLTTSAFNLSSATVATANATSFTVTNSAGSGVTITAQTGRVEATNAADLGDGAGAGNILVPNVLGLTTGLALDALLDRGYTAANITTAAGATNTAIQPTQIVVTAASGSTPASAVVTVTGAGASYPVGTKVTIASGTGIPAALVGTWSVTANSTNSVTISGAGTATAWVTADSGAITPGTKWSGASGTIKTQSVAANAASQAYGSSITITPWA